MDINKIKRNPDNPRVIKDEKFKKLVKSIREFPEMLNLRPLVIDENNVVLGGNMRLMACKELGLKEVPTIQASELSEEQKKEFIIKDNVGFGEWDWDMLANEWDEAHLNDWGLDLWQPDEDAQPKEEEHYWQLTTKSDDQTSIMNIAADLKKRGYEVKVSEK